LLKKRLQEVEQALSETTQQLEDLNRRLSDPSLYLHQTETYETVQTHKVTQERVKTLTDSGKPLPLNSRRWNLPPKFPSTPRTPTSSLPNNEAFHKPWVYLLFLRDPSILALKKIKTEIPKGKKILSPLFVGFIRLQPMSEVASDLHPNNLLILVVLSKTG
jgi:hypothetical protein